MENQFTFTTNFTHFVSGGFGLATAFAVMHPLDTLKTQLQTQSLNWRGLFRGFHVSFLLAFPQGGLRLMTYEYSKHHLNKHSNYGTIASALAACAGDTVSSIVKVPREVITQRLQSGVDRKHLAKDCSPTMQTIQLIIKEKGVRGLFNGFWSTTLRDWPFMIILFTTYDTFKQNHKAFHSRIDQHNVSFTLYGGISGFLAGFFTAPMDIVKTKIMTSDTPLSISSVTKSIYRANGIKGFFVGASARSVWWFCVCSMFFPIYEASKDVVGQAIPTFHTKIYDRA